MQVRGLVWLGTRTPQPEAMIIFCKQALGLTASREEPGFALFELPDGATLEVFGPDSEGGGHPEAGAVAGFLVDDVEAARAELAAAGCEVRELHRHDPYAWAYFTAPDGNLYEVTSGPYPTP